MKVMLVVLNLITLCSSCDLEHGWLGIKPLVTSRTAIEKKLGRPERLEDGFAGYRTSEAYINVEYSSLPCVKSAGYRGSYNVPTGTALNYIVTLAKPRKLSELDLDKLNFEKSGQEGHLLNYFVYSSTKEGITIEVTVRDETEYATTILFAPSVSDEKQFKCK